MDETFVYKQGADPAFQTDADRAAELGRQAYVAYDVKAHITFKGDSLREGIFGDGKDAQIGVDTATTDAMLNQGIDVDEDEPIQVQSGTEAAFSGAAMPTTTVTSPQASYFQAQPLPTQTTQIPVSQAPPPSRSGAYYETLHQKSKRDGFSHLHGAAGHVTGMTQRSISATAQMVGVGDDFDTYSVNNAGIQATVAGVNMQAAAVVTGATAAHELAGGTARIVADVRDGTITAGQAVSTGGRLMALEGKKSVLNLGSSGVRAAMRYMESFQAVSDDFAGNVPTKLKDAATSGVHLVGAVKNFLMHPIRSIKSMLKLLLIAPVLLLLLLLITTVCNMASSTVATVLCSDSPADMQTLVSNINDYRNESITEELYTAFQGDYDPNGNPYGYATLSGQRSNNLQHGVTWNYANGISNNTAEIISLAAVYYQQGWPDSVTLAAFGDATPFTQYCRALTAYGLNVTAQESAPYSCMAYGGCVNGYRSEGETVTIQDYRQETHTCSEGDSDCGEYGYNGIWHWDDGHGDGETSTEWVEDGTHDVTVLFPVVFPDTAGASELCNLPEGAVQMAGESISAADCTGTLVLPESANLYNGVQGDWFNTPGDFSATFTVVTGEEGDSVEDAYTVDFSNATAIPWCPGELHDGNFGHYDLNCTIYLNGYDAYTEPETAEPDGNTGGTGTLEPLAASLDAGSLTRTIIKQDQFGNEYPGNAVTARFTQTVTLPAGADGFEGWYSDGEDAHGNVEWASTLYRMDWEELYGVSDGIKCQTLGSTLSAEELQALLAGLNIDPETARGQVVAFALACQGHYVYGQPTSLAGGPGAPIVGSNLDCSSFIRYCFWAQGLPYSAGQTAAYRNAGDLRPISAAEAQPGDLRVVYAQGDEQGHVQMYLGGGSWIECCYGHGVSINMSNNWMERNGSHYFAYAGF